CPRHPFASHGGTRAQRLPTGSVSCPANAQASARFRVELPAALPHGSLVCQYATSLHPRGNRTARTALTRTAISISQDPRRAEAHERSEMHALCRECTKVGSTNATHHRLVSAHLTSPCYAKAHHDRDQRLNARDFSRSVVIGAT